jgi:hypothetical protein
MTEAEKDALIAQLTQRNEELEKQVIARKFLPKSISGTIQLSFPKEGATVEKTYSIASGFPKVWTPQGNQVATETALSLALGNAITQAQLTDNPHLLDIVNPNTLKDNGKAKALFVDFAKRGASILVEMEAAAPPVTP